MSNKFVNTIIKIIIIIAMIFAVIFTIWIFTNSSKATDETDKIDSEISYLDTKIFIIINGLNNINLQNYQVSISKIEEEENSSSSSSGSGESSSENKESSEEMGEKSSIGSSKTTGTESPKNEEKITVTKMELETANNGNSEPNWKNLQSEAEMLSQAWATVILDLYKTDINQDDILNFSATLNDVVMNLNKKDKIMSAMYTAKLYSFLPKFFNSKSNQVLKYVIETKSHIVNAYAYIETDNWDKIQEEVNSAESMYSGLMNDVSLAKDQRKYSINKAYIFLEELKNSLGTKDKEVFYMKYKSLIEGLNWIE